MPCCHASIHPCCRHAVMLCRALSCSAVLSCCLRCHALPCCHAVGCLLPRCLLLRCVPPTARLTSGPLVFGLSSLPWMDGISPWSLHVQESFDYILCSDDDLYPCDVPAVNRLPILSDFHAMPPIRKVEYHGEFFPGRQGQSCDQTCRDLGACTAWPCSAERTITTPHHTTPHYAT